MAENWNLVSAGPSREFLRPEHLLDGPVVTVNRAIDIVGRGLPVDFAAFADGPDGCWKICNLVEFWRPGMLLWVTLRPVDQKVRPQGMTEDVVIPGPPIAYLWDKELPAQAGLRFMPTGSIRDFENPGKYRHAFSTMCALKGIWSYKPKKVRILCADMKGSWIAGMTEDECYANDKKLIDIDRWAHERRAMDAEIKRGRKDLGVEVEEVTPEPLLQEAV
jgi:hypothetical protein